MQQSPLDLAMASVRDVAELIPGVRFLPDGRFLVDHYLLPRAVHGRVPDGFVRDAVADGVDVRAARPDALPFPRCNRLRSGEAWGYFFTTRRPSSVEGEADGPQRAAGGGRWERYGGEKAYAGAEGDAVAFRTMYAFHDRGEVRTPWRMKEFRLNEGVRGVDMNLVVWKVYNEVPVSDDNEGSAAEAVGANPNPNPVVAKATQEKFACEGIVKRKFDMEPNKENFTDIGKSCLERTRKSMIESRKVQVLENDHGRSMGSMPDMVGLAPSGSEENMEPIPGKASDVKRTKMDRRELENIPYRHFEKHPNRPLKQLMQEPDQPEQFLKEIQNDMCVYNKGGPNQGTD